MPAASHSAPNPFNPTDAFWVAKSIEAAQRMQNYERFPRDIRDLIKEFNMAPVLQLHAMGMRDAAKIREVLETRAREGDEAAKKKFSELVSVVTKSVDRALVRPSRMKQEQWA